MVRTPPRARKESKGQQVKTFKHWIPQSDLKPEETIVKVYFKPEDGKFYIYVPEHVTTYMPEINDRYSDTRDALYHGRAGYVTSPVMDRVIEAFKSILRQYENKRKDEKRDKVIQVEFSANHPGRSQYTQDRLEGISFCGRPAIYVHHQVLWRVGDTLYRIRQREFEIAERDGTIPVMEYAGRMPGKEVYQSRTQKTFVMDWTEEREAFFIGIAGGMRNMIEACMALLFGDTSANVDLMIANGGAGALISAPTLLLAKPEGEPPPARQRTRPTPIEGDA